MKDPMSSTHLDIPMSILLGFNWFFWISLCRTQKTTTAPGRPRGAYELVILCFGLRSGLGRFLIYCGAANCGVQASGPTETQLIEG